jgi:tetratricopeptide (TPR) repeat protein
MTVGEMVLHLESRYGSNSRDVRLLREVENRFIKTSLGLERTVQKLDHIYEEMHSNLSPDKRFLTNAVRDGRFDSINAKYVYDDLIKKWELPVKTICVPGDVLFKFPVTPLTNGYWAVDSGMLVTVENGNKRVTSESDLYKIYNFNQESVKKGCFLGEMNDRKWVSFAMVNLGMVMEQSDLSQEAYSLYEQAILSDPKNSNAHHRIGCLKMIYRTDDLGESDFVNTLKLHPLSEDALHNMGLVNLIRGKNKQAMFYFDRALASNPKSICTLNSKANLLISERKFREAKKCYDFAIDVSDEPFLREGRAAANEAMEEYEEVINDLESIFDEDDPLQCKKLADMHEKIGDEEEKDFLENKAKLLTN